MSPIASVVAIATFGTALAAAGLALTLFVYSMTPQFIPSPSLVMILVVGTHVLLAATDVTSAAVTASLLCRSKTGSAWSMKLIRNLGVAQALQASFTA
ncbi:hypothetical protein FKP32DRAFT_1670599 [Trametes sanguinea]|nr:hypothetical protein FKP32DRAFT_1670599 [Trametes sanguinea]